MKNEATTPRKLKISILRFNPQERGSVPRMVTYELDEAEGMTLLWRSTRFAKSKSRRSSSTSSAAPASAAAAA